VRRDHADIFCTIAEGVRGSRAKDWRLVDHVVKPQQFTEYVRNRALELAAQSDRPADAKGVALEPLQRTIDADGYHYQYVDVRLDRAARRAMLTVRGPSDNGARTEADIVAAGCHWWPLQMARELDDTILSLRTNELDIGLWVLKTTGDPQIVIDLDATLDEHRRHWFVRETIGMLRRTLARLDVTSRSLFALIEPGSCFAGTLFELALAADRSYMLDAEGSAIAVSAMNFGALPMVNGLTRIASRFYEDAAPVEAVLARLRGAIRAHEAETLGLVTTAPDELDWDALHSKNARACRPTR
jgi:benzoyl-CoA-dihydrodiol lyase